MAKMSGFEVYRRIKDTNPLMPIAFISAFEINEDEFSKVMRSIKVRDLILSKSRYGSRGFGSVAECDPGCSLAWLGVYRYNRFWVFLPDLLFNF
jgi:CheY-like chemotaxis protein